jgi:N-acetyl sugar amidotransferase
MKICSKCFYTELHPLGITFNDDGVCSGCIVHEEKLNWDWEAREQKLRKMLNEYKSPTGNFYDCIVPVSGGRDSYFIVHMIKNVYGLNPLLVTYNKHFNTEVGLRNYAYLKTKFDCDAVMMVCDPKKIKKITRVTLKKMGSMYWHVIAGQTVFPVQVATRLKIPLIIWGAHQGVDQVGMFSHQDEVEMTRKYRKEHDLMGFEAEDLLRNSDLSEADVAQFFYPHDKELEKVGVRGIYLGNYIPWDSKSQHELMIEKYSYETNWQQRTFDTYNDIDCLHYSGLHDYIKYIKHGYSKVTDHCARELRWGRLSRQEGVQLIKKYSDIIPKDIKFFSQWIDISGEVIFDELNEFRDPRVWKQNFNGEWRLKVSLDDLFETKKAHDFTEDKLGFRIENQRQCGSKETFGKLLARGFIDD